MGGHAAGEVASRTAVDTLSDFIRLAVRDQDFTWPFGFDEKRTREENLLHSAVMLANRKVCEIAQENPDCLGMGTTLAVLHIRENQAILAHVGDSRIYRLRDNEFEQMTVDHSWVNEQLQRNVLTEEEARNHRWRNVITRALGNRPDIEIDIKSVDLRPGDVFLLCSDGLTTMIEDAIVSRLVAALTNDLEAACRSLIALANQSGGHDNISVILVRVDS